MPQFSKSLRAVVSGLLAWATIVLIYRPNGRNFNLTGRGPEETLDALIFWAIFGVYYFFGASSVV